MTGRSPSIFVDTNVWLDYYLAERPYHASACQLIDYVVAHGLVMYSCIPSLKDLYFLYQRQRKREIREALGDVSPEQTEAISSHAWQIIREVRQIATFVTLDAIDIDYAIGLQHIHNDFEDNLILAATRRAYADFLVTNDVKFRNHSPILAFDSTTMFTVLEAQRQTRAFG